MRRNRDHSVGDRVLRAWRVRLGFLRTQLRAVFLPLSLKHQLAMADSIVLATAVTRKGLLWTQDSHFENLPSAMRYDAGMKMFDASYAAAWQLGRLLALSSLAFSTSLLGWKKTVRERIVRISGTCSRIEGSGGVS